MFILDAYQGMKRNLFDILTRIYLSQIMEGKMFINKYSLEYIFTYIQYVTYFCQASKLWVFSFYRVSDINAGILISPGRKERGGVGVGDDDSIFLYCLFLLRSRLGIILIKFRGSRKELSLCHSKHSIFSISLS